ncbi:MAG: TPR repeat protein [Gammaproteobacteria bacterium]
MIDEKDLNEQETKMRITHALPVLLILMFSNPALADFAKGWTAYQIKDYTTALKEWEPLAEQGHADAHSNLGTMYANGLGVIKNYDTAAEWYRPVAEQGHADAQFYLGVTYPPVLPLMAPE